MPGPLRLGKDSGPTVLGMVTAATLVVALVVTGRLLSVARTRTSAQPSQTTAAAPYRIGDRVLCPLGHPVLATAKRRTAFAVACAGERPVALARVRGREGRLYECPPQSGPHGGGVLVRWEERDTILVVSVSGRTDLHRRIVLVLAAHLDLVQPGK